ncbi:hypothetical protein BX616_000563 [Lobosporangium transversale]|nr:hypothetical protein BX616_000563 [Lobosporangium transversale]
MHTTSPQPLWKTAINKTKPGATYFLSTIPAKFNPIDYFNYRGATSIQRNALSFEWSNWINEFASSNVKVLQETAVYLFTGFKKETLTQFWEDLAAEEKYGRQQQQLLSQRKIDLRRQNIQQLRMDGEAMTRELEMELRAMPSTSLKTTLDSNNDDSTTNAANTNTINTAYGPSTLDINCPPGQEELGKSINRSITPNHEPRVFFFDIDNCLYSKHCGIAELMRAKIEQYFRDVGFESDHVQTISYRYYIDYGLAIRGLVLHHPVHCLICYNTYLEIDIKDYDDKVDGALPLQDILKENIPLRNMIKSLNIEKKWLFTNAGKNHALRVIKILGLEGCFDGLTYCDYLKPDFNCKPEPEAFYRAMKDAGVVHPSNCYLVDDSAANVDKALDIGWTAVHVADDPEVSQFGHFQIGDILELPKALPEFWSKEDAAAALSAVNAVASEKAPGTGKARLSA